MNNPSRRLLGEVFTPTTLVKQIVDSYVPEVLFNSNYTVLEPAVGDGRFLTYILHHRLLQSQDAQHVIQSLSTLYGIDIQKDNNIIHGCAITKKYPEVDEPIKIRYYEILSINPIKIKVNVYMLDDVLSTGQHNSLFNAPLILSRYIID